MTQEEYDKAPKIEQILYDKTGMLAKNHTDIIEAMTEYAESEVKKLNIFSVVFSETANICKTCYKPIKMVDNTLQLLCECESVAEVCEHKETYKKVRFGVELTKCKKCRKILSQT